MKLSKCVEVISANVLVTSDDMDLDVNVACGADLMSDVMAFSCSMGMYSGTIVFDL